ncbi:hypothetical protein CLOM621_05957 [Clostridium sp. M62/1]|nr:hypothetical protein CLOM621_05957 [Clostridium sp. M62/1]
MTADQSLYLRIPVSAFTAESRALDFGPARAGKLLLFFTNSVTEWPWAGAVNTAVSCRIIQAI